MSEVQTWTPDINWLGHDNGLAAMRPATGGMWVSVSDYDAARDHLAETLAANATLMSWLDEARAAILKALKGLDVSDSIPARWLTDRECDAIGDAKDAARAFLAGKDK